VSGSVPTLVFIKLEKRLNDAVFLKYDENIKGDSFKRKLEHIK